MSPTLMRASVDCAHAVHHLFREVVSPLTFYNEHARNFELSLYTKEKFVEIISEDADAVWVACLNKTPVGFSIVEPDRDLWWFSWIGVNQLGRGHGIGRLLVNNMLEIASRKRIRKISCVTRPANTSSISILVDTGFERVCDLADHWFGEDYILWQTHP